MSQKMAFWIDTDEMNNAVTACVQCEACIDVCCTASLSAENMANPMNRLSVIDSLLSGQIISDTDVHAIYTCTECGRCDTICPVDIPVSSVIADSKVVMVHKDIGPLPKHNDMVANLLKHRNAVNRPVEDRFKWLRDDEFNAAQNAESNTLLYLGCMASYLDTATARASFHLLKNAGVSFKIMADEFCCGIYPYNAGKFIEAESIFREQFNQFKKNGIKKIIAPCAGCYRAFSDYYPRVLADFDIDVLHISEVLHELAVDNRIKFLPVNGSITVHDSCKTGRKSGIYDAPRALLQAMGFSVSEIPENRENGLCCGAGSGVRSIEPSLSMKIGGVVLDAAPDEQIVSTCPFCIFNLGYIAKKQQRAAGISHIASLVYSHTTNS